MRSIICIAVVVAGVFGCGGQKPKPATADSPVHGCERTDECVGGFFCDRGTCAATDTQVSGHGYGAQCVPEEAYPYPEGRGEHCRKWSCHDGHCSSCVSDDECTQEGQTCLSEPGRAGRFCERIVVDSTRYREDQRAELPGPTLLPAKEHQCDEVSDCRGDEFCDRGKCTPIMVDIAGHGYGSFCKRVEEPTPGEAEFLTCLQYVCVDSYCSSCLADSECWPEAPFCIKGPLWPNGHICSPQPASFWYDDDGKLRPEREELYQDAMDRYETYQMWRARAGLPVDRRHFMERDE